MRQLLFAKWQHFIKLDVMILDFNWLDDGNRYLRSALTEYESVRQV